MAEDEEKNRTPPELQPLIDLIGTLIKVNKNVITLSTILNIQRNLMRDYPSIILKFKVDRNFDLDCSMEGADKDLEALGRFLESYIRALSDLLPPRSLSDRICTMVKDLGEEPTLELLASGATEFLPVELEKQIRIAADFGDELNDLRDMDVRTQAITVYEGIFSKFLEEALENIEGGDRNTRTLSRKLEHMVLNHYEYINTFDVAENGHVRIETDDVDLEMLLEALAHIYDSIVYGVSTIWDEKEARDLGRRAALTVLGDYEDVPDKCGVTASLLKGALSSRMRTGILGLDRLLDGGLERNSNTFLISPNLIERDFLLSTFIRKGFHSGEDILIVVTDMDTDRMLEMLSDEEAPTSEGHIPLGKVKLHVFRPVKDVKGDGDKDGENGEEDQAIQYEGPKDLLGLHKFLKEVVRNYGPGPKRAVIQILDKGKEVFGPEKLYWYLNRYLSTMKEHGFSSLFIGSRKRLGKDFISDILDLFENTLEIRKRRSSFSYEIGRTAAKKPVMDPEFKLLSFSDRGISISNE